ncbi:GDP-L-fucose synthase [Luteibacter sp. UNCMF331Sha3.1]|uniref:NAD-dependent epimerase/dehydratase family protein n=1 Tax=Luteibacter sp. UNCMF331Sha3.1 TaxID=1502760 RepID=UPI0008CB9BFB|nr:NAD-dependent epimerase/dehydratase family protein [Luteibacter sp. UNCMF331Sha3.1]SEM92562.1 GDP-L-fucose synthase [Luteibacter sp. UNCMF331Sha3.1]
MNPFDLDAPIYVAGHRGLAGSAIVRRLEHAGASNILTRTRAELDLRDQAATEAFFATERPAYVFLAAAKVGGIHANATYPADFIGENLAIQTNVIHSAWKHGTRKLLFLGSSCIYPRDCPQPIKEDYLLTGPLEPTNEAYAIAKIAGLAMCQAYRRQYGFDAISAMPTNLYGPGDNFHPENSHVLPALIRRFVEAANSQTDHVSVWGSGTPLREFMHVDDMADAAVFLMDRYSDVAPVNIGSNDEVSIATLAQTVASAAGFGGGLVWDTTKPDGTPRKRLDSSRLLSLGWKPSIPLHEGIDSTVAWYRHHVA